MQGRVVGAEGRGKLSRESPKLHVIRTPINALSDSIVGMPCPSALDTERSTGAANDPLSLEPVAMFPSSGPDTPDHDMQFWLPSTAMKQDLRSLRVVANARNQLAIVPARATLPPGWRVELGPTSLEQCR